MTAEERILAYLDGSLTESESAELLHQLSVSPEKRVVLEQHLKLAELNRLAQKPFEVPAELEEKMRRRLPIIIPSEGAGTVAVRRGVISSLLLLLRSYPMRFALGSMIVLLGVAGGYMLSNSNTGISPAPVSQNVQNTAPTPRTPSAPFETKNTTPTNSTLGTSPAIPSKNASRVSASTSSTTTRTSIGTNSTQVTNHSGSVAHRVNRTVNIINPPQVEERNEVIADHSTNQTTAIPPATSIGIVEPAAITSQPMASISQAEIREPYRLNPLEMSHNPLRSPWTVRFSLGMGETFLNVPTGDNSYTTRTETSPFIGVNYSVSPSFAVGAVVGNSTILSVSPQTETTVVNGIKNVEVHTYSANSHEWFARLASRYSMSLGGSWSLETSAEAGMLLASKSPMVCLQALGNQSLSDAIDFQFGVLASGVWTTPAAIQTSSADQNSTSDIITYRTHSTTTQTKIFSPAITGRVGLQYRF